MAEHHEITGLTYAKTEQIGNASFSGVEGSDYSAGVSGSAQKKRKYNDPSIKGPSSGILDSQNPISIFNRVVNTNLNPPSVSFSLKQTETIKKKISKKKRDEVSTEADIRIQTYEFGAINGKDYRKIMGNGQIVMLDAQYWKDNAELLTNAQASVFERAKKVEENNTTYGSSPHAHSVGMVNDHLQSKLNAKQVSDPSVMLERYRPMGVLKGVMMQQYGAFQKILVHLFGTVRGDIHLFNYWMLCSLKPCAGVHLWFTLVKIAEGGKEYFQWLPCTTYNWTPPSIEHKSCMLKYLENSPTGKKEKIQAVYESIHIGKATNTHCLRNPDHWTEIVKQMTRYGGPNQKVWSKADKSQLYLRDALLC